MTVQDLNSLSCDRKGNVIDWDNSHWSIPSTLAQTDATLSCSEYRTQSGLTSDQWTHEEAEFVTRDDMNVLLEDVS